MNLCKVQPAILSLFLVSTFLIVQQAQAQTGSISGTVTELNTSEVITGANVGLEATKLGDVTTQDGNFRISNIPEGEYTLRASFVGYGTVERTINVISGKTTRVLIELSRQDIELGGVTIVGRRGGFLVEEVATANKIDVPLVETPQSISVITSSQIESQEVDNLAEALRYTPGVQGETFGFEPRTTFVRIRGFDATTTGLYRDGLQLRNPRFAIGYNIEPYGAERIAVLRGPASVLYGASSPGGLVNFVSKRPTQKAFGEIEFETGSFNRLEGKFDLSGPIDSDGAFSYRLTGLARDSDTQIDFVENNRLFFAPAITWRPGRNTSLTVLGHYQQDDTRSSQRLPGEGTLFDNTNGSIPTDTFTGEPDVDKYDRNEFSASSLFEHTIGNTWTFRQKTRFYSNDLDDITIFTAGLREDERTIDRFLFESFGEADGLAIDNQVQLNFGTGPASHTLLAGLDYQTIDVNSVQTFGGAPALDIFDPDFGAEVPEAPVFGNTDTRQRQVGVYVQERITFYEKLILSLNGRYDWANTETDNNLSETTTEQDDQEFTGRVGLLYLSEIGLAPYVSYSESFLPSLGTNEDGTPFDPERGRQFETGIKYQPPGSNSFIAAAYFDLTRENFLQVDPVSFLQVQTGEANSSGIELRGVASFENGLDFIANFTYQDVEITESSNPDEVGERPTQTPEYNASAWVDYKIQNGVLEGLGFGGGVRFLGSSFGDTPNTLEVPSATLADAALYYDVNRFQLQLNIQNVFDNEYVASAFTSGGNFATFGQVRTLKASIRYRW